MRSASSVAAIFTMMALLIGSVVIGGGTPAYGETATTVSSGPQAENLGSADSLMGRHHRGHPPKAEAYDKAVAEKPVTGGPAAENIGSPDSLMGRTHRSHPPKPEAYEKAQKN